MYAAIPKSLYKARVIILASVNRREACTLMHMVGVRMQQGVCMLIYVILQMQEASWSRTDSFKVWRMKKSAVQ